MGETAQPTQKKTSIKSQSGKWIRLITLALLVIGLITAVKLLPVSEWLIQALEWIRGLGLWAPIFFVLIYIVACVLFLPGSIITLGAGFVFQVFWGTVIVSIGSTLGACAAFILGRTIARDWITQKAAENKKFAALDQAVGKQGFKIVLLTRLSPLFPFNFLNYAFGLTKVPFAQYALASWIGMLPGTIMFVYIGSSLSTLAEAAHRESGRGDIVFWGIGLVVAVAVVLVVTRLARKALKEAVPQNKKINR